MHNLEYEDCLQLTWNLLSDPYPYITKGRVCLLGDAGHPVGVMHAESLDS
jgi:hypothetical protein